MKKSASSDNFFGGAICTLLIVIIATFVFFWGEYDLINTKAIGEMACKGEGIKYSHRKISCWDYDEDGIIECHIPIIYCKNESKKTESEWIIIKE